MRAEMGCGLGVRGGSWLDRARCTPIPSWVLHPIHEEQRKLQNYRGSSACHSRLTVSIWHIVLGMDQLGSKRFRPAMQSILWMCPCSGESRRYTYMSPVIINPLSGNGNPIYTPTNPDQVKVGGGWFGEPSRYWSGVSSDSGSGSNSEQGNDRNSIVLADKMRCDNITPRRYVLRYGHTLSLSLTAVPPCLSGVREGSVSMKQRGQDQNPRR